MVYEKLPRKIKKGLKLVILKGKDPAWKTKEVRILKSESYSRYRFMSPTFKGITVKHYTLG